MVSKFGSELRFEQLDLRSSSVIARTRERVNPKPKPLFRRSTLHISRTINGVSLCHPRHQRIGLAAPSLGISRSEALVRATSCQQPSTSPVCCYTYTSLTCTRLRHEKVRWSQAPAHTITSAGGSSEASPVGTNAAIALAFSHRAAPALPHKCPCDEITTCQEFLSRLYRHQSALCPRAAKVLILLPSLRSLNVEVSIHKKQTLHCTLSHNSPSMLPHLQSFHSVHVDPDTLHEISALVHPPTQECPLCQPSN